MVEIEGGPAFLQEGPGIVKIGLEPDLVVIDRGAVVRQHLAEHVVCLEVQTTVQTTTDLD